MTEQNEPDTPVVVQTADLEATQAYFAGELGFRLDRVFPADAPRTVWLSRGAYRVRLERVAAGELCEVACPTDVPFEPELVVSRAHDASAWSTGRAGMQYRDLIPGRLGGRYIASHIRIVEGGPVGDYVHYHDVTFQLIYVWKGAVTVAYQDQGEPRVFRSGDCILQPPGIRHRVLECTPGLEVIEVANPAEHVTHVDHELVLPNGTDPGREFGGQLFTYKPVEIARCSSGAVAVEEVSFDGEWQARATGEFDLLVLLDGSAELTLDGEAMAGGGFGAGDALVIPTGTTAVWVANGPAKVLRVTAAGG